MSSDRRTIDFPRFGALEIAADDEISFPWGLPGFNHLHSWVVLTLAPTDRYLWLQSLDDLSVAIPICDPWLIFEDYAPEMPSYAKAALQIEKGDDFVYMCIVIVTKDVAEMTMNLVAPIVINLRRRIGRQIPLETSDYRARTPIPRVAPASDDVQAAQEEAALS